MVGPAHLVRHSDYLEQVLGVGMESRMGWTWSARGVGVRAGRVARASVVWWCGRVRALVWGPGAIACWGARRCEGECTNHANARITGARARIFQVAKETWTWPAQRLPVRLEEPKDKAEVANPGGDLENGGNLESVAALAPAEALTAEELKKAAAGKTGSKARDANEAALDQPNARSDADFYRQFIARVGLPRPTPHACPCASFLLLLLRFPSSSSLLLLLSFLGGRGAEVAEFLTLSRLFARCFFFLVGPQMNRKKFKELKKKSAKQQKELDDSSDDEFVGEDEVRVVVCLVFGKREARRWARGGVVSVGEASQLSLQGAFPLHRGSCWGPLHRSSSRGGVRGTPCKQRFFLRQSSTHKPKQTNTNHDNNTAEGRPGGV